MEKLAVPFNRPSFLGNELKYISDAISAEHISGDGRFSQLCSEFLQSRLGAPKCLMTTSCTDALEMAALLLDIKPGDEVIVPSFTFVSSANAFVLRGAVPKFIDIRSDTLNMDEERLPDLITDRTRAVIPVHYAGVACEMDSILSICADRKIAVVEDNAHGLFGRYKGRQLGTFGAMATQSFHETKNFTCGEGGALILNNPDFVERGEILRDKGTNRKKFFRGFVDKYTWVDLGSSFLPSDILCAFLYAQLEKWEEVQTRRRNIWDFYATHLAPWAQRQGVRLPEIPEHCDQAYHMFYLLAPSLAWRNRLMEYLKAQEIYSVFHYLPLHLSEMGRKFGGKIGDCPNSESYSDRLLRLPFFTAMSQDQQNRVVDVLTEFA